MVAVNLQGFTSHGIYASRWDKADVPAAQGFAHKPRESWNEEADDFYAVSLGETQFIPCCSFMVLCGCAPAFHWETKANNCILVRGPLKKLPC